MKCFVDQCAASALPLLTKPVQPLFSYFSWVVLWLFSFLFLIPWRLLVVLAGLASEMSRSKIRIERLNVMWAELTTSKWKILIGSNRGKAEKSAVVKTVMRMKGVNHKNAVNTHTLNHSIITVSIKGDSHKKNSTILNM